jgi:hypothetical protein
MPRNPNPRKGRFYRPELETTWERFATSWTLRIFVCLVVLAATATLVTMAFMRFA